MNVVLCNCPPDEAAPLAKTLVEEGLAACVNIVPMVQSIYAWDGAIHDDSESTMLIKVASSRVDALSERLRQIHPYEVVEILVLPVDVERSDPTYVAWVRATPGGTP